MIDFAPHNMTDNALPLPYVASASTQAGGNHAYRCFDGSEAGGFAWISDLEAQAWLKIDLGADNAYIMSQYDITFAADQAVNFAPKNWTMKGSNNNVDWDIIDTVANELTWSQGEKRTFVCDIKTTPYRYFMIDISANNGGDRHSIAELYYFRPYPFKLTGTVKEKGSPVIRTIRSYNRSTGEFFDSIASLADGTFSVGAPDETTEMFIIAFDDDAGDQYNALIFDRVYGVPI